MVNTDNAVLNAWVVGAPLRVLAIDGRDLSGPTPVEGEAVLVAAGGRADLELVAPADGSAALVRLGAGADVVVGPTGSRAPADAATVAPTATLDLLSYGRPVSLGFDPWRADRTFTYAVGRRFAFVADNPGIWLDHCHNLPHADQGLVAHLVYAGISEPFRVGGGAANKPE
ncbi:multicopper oxidase domain-containing protein [Pengzhenrongella sp.]|uniref:multicopper oxidase domain-containing protein n=1 Tax=Pengzhenrongella sp. TaxID=2888820 RepID=UPI002F951378